MAINVTLCLQNPHRGVDQPYLAGRVLNLQAPNLPPSQSPKDSSSHNTRILGLEGMEQCEEQVHTTSCREPYAASSALQLRGLLRDLAGITCFLEDPVSFSIIGDLPPPTQYHEVYGRKS